jgi:hypothetical protein
LIVTIQGQGLTHPISCVALVDFSLPAKGSLISLTVLSGDVAPLPEQSLTETTQPSLASGGETASSTTTVISPITRNPDVTQFPLNPEKGLTYSSSRGGYAIHFPSPNISYVSSAIQENFGSASLLCSNVINVIKYAEKENLEISPALRIYECSVKGELPVLGEQYLIAENGGKTFVIQINDSAWIDFANALSFSAL